MPQRGPLIYGRADVPELTRVKWEDLTEAVPARMTAVMMPFGFHHRGDRRGLHLHCVIPTEEKRTLKTKMPSSAGRWREINPCVLVVALLFVLKFGICRCPRDDFSSIEKKTRPKLACSWS